MGGHAVAASAGPLGRRGQPGANWNNQEMKLHLWHLKKGLFGLWSSPSPIRHILLARSKFGIKWNK